MNTEQPKSQSQKRTPIDFGAIWAAIKKHRKLYYKVLPVAFVVGFVIGISIPKTYTCKVLLAPGGGRRWIHSRFFGLYRQ